MAHFVTTRILAERRTNQSADPIFSSLLIGIFLFAFTSFFWAYLTLYRFYWIAYLLCFTVAIMGVTLGKLKSQDLLGKLMPLGVFYCFLLASSTWAEYPQVTLDWTLYNGINLVVFIVAYILALSCTKRQLSIVFACVPTVIAVVMAYCFVMYGAVRVSYDQGEEAVTMLGALSNSLALYLVVALPVLLWRVYMTKSKVITVLNLVASCIMVFLTQSRMAVLGTAFVLIVTLPILAPNRRSLIKGAIAAFLAVAITVTVLMSFEQGHFYVESTLDRFSAEQTSVDISSVESGNKVDEVRRLQYFHSRQNFYNNPWLGIGYMNTMPSMEYTYGMAVSSHGLVSTLLSELGVLGTVIFVWMMACFFFGLCRAIKTCSVTTNADIEDRSFYLVCLATMAALLFLGAVSQIQDSQLFYIVLAWGFAFSSQAGRMSITQRKRQGQLATSRNRLENSPSPAARGREAGKPLWDQPGFIPLRSSHSMGEESRTQLSDGL